METLELQEYSLGYEIQPHKRLLIGKANFLVNEVSRCTEEFLKEVAYSDEFRRGLIILVLMKDKKTDDIFIEQFIKCRPNIENISTTLNPHSHNMKVFELAQQATSKEEFVKFLQALIDDFTNNKARWENPELGRYLEAMEAFLKDSTDLSINKIDFTPSWSLFATIMYTATIYE